MDLKHIKELMTLMEKAGVTKIRIKDKDKYEIEIEREEESPPQLTEISPRFTAPLAPPPISRGGTAHELPPAVPQGGAIEGRFITAPLVGTVYHSPSPEDAPFVKVGDKIDENSVVCIIEAMKVMNEVKAGISGTVAEVLVTNGHPVEFGAKLIRIV